MNRHVLQIGRRPIPSTVAPLWTSPIAAGPFASAVRIPEAQLLQRSYAVSLPSRAGTSDQDAAIKNTQFPPLGPAARINHSVRSGSVPLPHGRAVSIAECLSHSRSGRHAFQRRFFSDEKSAGTTQGVGDTARKGTDGLGSAEASKATQANASPGAGNSKGILDRLPHLHRPTKYELLATAETFWQRLKINFKWYSIRSLRPFTTDEIGAFISWVFLGHLIWIVIGTTTFVSLAIWAVNTVFAQETLAGWVGNYLTKSSGLKFVFESAIVPTWSSGVITFNNVFVARRPGSQTKKERTVKKGSPITAAAAAEAAMAERSQISNDVADDGNYTQFDVTIKTVNVTLSFRKWFNGKGLLRDVEVAGVRGVIDRTSVQSRDYSIDPKSYRHEHNPGDFEIDNFRMSDVLLTVHQPNKFRPFTVSVFNCDLPRLRKQWLFYDLMSANNMSGSFDDSLFTVHPRQVHGTTGAQLLENGMEQDQWKKHSRLRIDGLNIDHLNRGVEGPFSWIREGNVDIVADVMIPNDDDNIWRQSWRKSTEAMSELYDQIEATVSSTTQVKPRSPDSSQTTIHHSDDAAENSSRRNAEQQQTQQSDSDRRLCIFDIKVHLNDVRASVPLFNNDLSYVNNALVRPIVAYINSRPHAFIPVTCRVVKRQSEFDGSWTVFDSGLLDDLSRETYEAFARDIEDVSARKRRMRKVGLWSLQLAAQALFIGLAGQLA